MPPGNLQDGSPFLGRGIGIVDHHIAAFFQKFAEQPLLALLLVTGIWPVILAQHRMSLCDPALLNPGRLAGSLETDQYDNLRSVAMKMFRCPPPDEKGAKIRRYQ